MTFEKWDLPFFKKAGLQPATTSTAAWTDIEFHSECQSECACCQICNYPGGCDVCQRTYHWKCMEELGCYTGGQRQEIDAADTWACPACAGLNNSQKIDRMSV
eukprot:1156740-Pelagomonas_calceolata.AAC.1